MAQWLLLSFEGTEESIAMDDHTNWQRVKRRLLQQKLLVKEAETRLAFLKLLIAQLRSRDDWRGGSHAA